MRTWKRFKKDERGATALIFSLALIPLFGFVGAALDYSRASSGRTAMQRSLDATALALAREAGKLSDAALEARGRQIYDGLMKAYPEVRTQPISIVRTDKTIRVTGQATVATTVMGIAGFEVMPISTETEVAWGTNKIEIALVLDNTGSMNSANKLDELKKAAYRLIDTLEAASPEKGAIRVSIVPFNTQVNVGPSIKPWVKFVPGTNYANAKTVAAPAWRGCLADRDNPYDTNDAAPDTIKPATLYPAVECLKEQPWRPDLARVLPLTDDWASARTTIGAMTGNGWTNIPVGLSHGLATLSPGEPYGGAQPYGTPNVKKFIILLTDGENTMDRNTTSTSAIDNRTRNACREVKDEIGSGPKKDIRLYTIRVIQGNANLLRDCASRDPATGAPLYYDVQNASKLDAVFQSIVDGILATRLTV